MHFTILLYAPEPAPGEIAPEVIEAAKAGYRSFASELVARGVFVAGEVFDAEDTAVCVAERDGVVARVVAMAPAVEDQQDDRLGAGGAGGDGGCRHDGSPGDFRPVRL